MLLIAIHGTRSAVGVATISRLTQAVEAALNEPVAVGFLDVVAPTLGDVLVGLEGPVTIVPALLSTGYHVTVDIPGVVANRPRTQVARHLGPARRLSAALAGRLATGRPVALVGAGSSHPTGLAELTTAAADLADLLQRPVHPLTVSAGLAETIAALGPVEVAPYLLAEGFFYDRIRAAAGSAPAAGVLGAHPQVVDLIVERYLSV